LSFSAADSCFEIIGPQINFSATDHIVIGSTQWNQTPTSPYDTAAGTGVLRAYGGAAGPSSIVQMTAAQLPASAELPSQRFQVVDGTQQGVTYACVDVGTDANGNGTGSLMRYWGYGFQTAQVAPPATVGGATGIGALAHQAAILAENISDCNFVYDIVNQRSGLVAITLRITQANETVSLYEEVHVNNAP
jgi:MSHA biogenesis protein MshO